MGTIKITKTITTFEATEDQKILSDLVTELMNNMANFYRFGKMQLTWHEGRLVKIEVERSEKDVEEKEDKEKG